MIFNLKAATRKNQEQDWLKSSLARFARMLQGQHDTMMVAVDLRCFRVRGSVR